MSLSGVSRHGIRTGSILLAATILGFSSNASASNVTLAWDPSSDPTVAGYNIYIGGSSHNYTNVVDAGHSNSITISNLVPGSTYYFAATTYTLAGLESDYSTEAAYTVPVSTNGNAQPTLDPILSLTVVENSGNHVLNLSGISSGSPTENQTLVVTAFSSDQTVIPNPTVTYTSPNSTGTLTFSPVRDIFGSADITVMVDDGGAVSNAVIRTFTVNINPVNYPPTLDALNDIVLSQNSGTQTVQLKGISSGSSNEVQTLAVTAVSSNPSLINNPTVSYSSPDATGALSFTPAANVTGSARITVTVDDGQTLYNTVTRSFAVTINQTNSDSALLTNAIIAPNTAFRLPLSSPYANNDRISFDLATGAPAGAKVVSRRGQSYLTWTPTVAQALTTNLLTIVLTDSSNPTLSTNQYALITVLDYLGLVVGSTSVAAGQSGQIPIYLSSSSGVTNLSFSVDWAPTRFVNASLTAVVSGIGASSVQVQNTNLLLSFQAAAGQVLQKSNLIAQLTFQTVSNQSSAFVNLAVRNLNAAKPDSSAYVNYVPVAGQVAVVSSKPLLSAGFDANTNRTLTAFGNIGARYQIQSSSNPAAANGWTTLSTYTQTNISQPLPVDPANPFIFYRLLLP